MKRTLLIAVLFIIGGIVSILTYPYSEENKVVHCSPTFKFRLIVNLEKGIDSGKNLYIIPDSLHSKDISNLLREYNISKLQAVFRNRYTTAGILKSSQNKSDKFSLYRQVMINDLIKADELVQLLLKEKGVLEAYIEKPIHFNPFATPYDPQYGSQWYLNASYNPISDIRAAQAWDINKGRNDVIIAVCDGGVDYNHRDLDTGNRTRVIAGYDSGSDDYDPLDDLPYGNTLSYAGHGTHVAGIIGAITDNNLNTSGIMWNCKIMPVKMVGSGSVKLPFIGTIWDFSTTAFPSDVADAIDYAVNNGANVINLSYGFNSMGFPLNEIIFRVPLLYSTIANAYNQNVVVVAAMGNEYTSGNPIEYPAAFAHEVISVGASTESLARWGGSNTGPHIDISAPGNNILSTLRGGGTIVHSGTSMATPIVSGVAGLIISQGKDHNFNLTNDDVRNILEITADDMGTPGYDEETGYGKVNAFSALSLINSPNSVIHGNSFGGTSVVISTLNPWIYSGQNRWNLTAGSYYSVDEYQITKHINFAVPFCSVPKVWIRDRESISLSFANPNDGYPWAEISNITTTGFDLRYAVYYVRYNSLGQTLNKWVPSTLANSKIEYTAVGAPNIAGTAGPITGQPLVCSSTNSTFTLSYHPAGTTVNWTKSTNLVEVSGQGTDNYVVRASSSSGIGWVQATITPTSGGCGSVTLPQFPVWVGPPVLTIDGPSSGYVNNTYNFYINSATSYSSSAWSVNPSYGNYLYPQTTYAFISFVEANRYDVMARATNTCGLGDYAHKTTYIFDNSKSYTLFPNPASDNVTITLTENPPLATTNDSYIANMDITKTSADEPTTYTIRVFNSYGTLLSSATRIGKSFTIPLSNLRDGIYIVEVRDGKNSYRQQLIVKHN